MEQLARLPGRLARHFKSCGFNIAKVSCQNHIVAALLETTFCNIHKPQFARLAQFLVASGYVVPELRHKASPSLFRKAARGLINIKRKPMCLLPCKYIFRAKRSHCHYCKSRFTSTHHTYYLTGPRTMPLPPSAHFSLKSIRPHSFLLSPFSLPSAQQLGEEHVGAEDEHAAADDGVGAGLAHVDGAALYGVAEIRRHA